MAGIDVSFFSAHSARAASTSTDLPLILILSVYTDFLTLKFGNIQIFPPKIRGNTDFSMEC